MKKNRRKVTIILCKFVLDKPGKPEGPITFSNITADTITVEWKPPLDTGNLELTKYILEKCEATKLIWTKVIFCLVYFVLIS